MAVDAVKIQGTDAVAVGDLKKLLATRSTTKFLGMAQGIFFEYRLYNHYVLQTDIQRVERIYRAHGYYHARVLSARVFFIKPNHVKVVIQVDEGEPTRIERVELLGLEQLSPEDFKAVSEQLRSVLRPNRVFVESEFQRAKDELLFALRDRGYARARVKGDARVDVPKHLTTIVMSAEPNEKCVYGEVIFQGLKERIPEKMVRRTLMLKQGDEYSQGDLLDAQKAALALGVFSSVQITPQLDENPESNVIPLLIKFEETPLQTLELGAGAQLDVVRAAVRGRIGWRSENFLGGLRSFSANVSPGIVFYPTRLQALRMPTALLPMVEASAQLRQPSFIEARTVGVVRGGFDLYPLLLSSQIDTEAPVLGYREVQGTGALERAFGSHVFLLTQYSLTSASPFAYRGELDPDLNPLLISSVEGFARFDTRNDLLFPTRGVATSVSVEYAGVGGDVRDLRVTPEVRTYIPMGSKLTLALRASTGLLFPFNWGSTVADGPDDLPVTSDRAAWVRDTQISLFRSYFAGGPNSNRGYAQRGIGPHGIIPFFVPDVQAPDLALACEENPNATRCLLPLGGRTLWELSAELRFPIWGDLHGATFCDAADVAPKLMQFRFNRPHLSCGLGARYATPVGPIRFDLGVRIPGLQTLGSDAGEAIPPELLGLPIAIALSIGEAF